MMIHMKIPSYMPCQGTLQKFLEEKNSKSFCNEPKTRYYYWIAYVMLLQSITKHYKLSDENTFKVY